MWNNDQMQNNENWNLSNLENLNIVIMYNSYLDGWMTFKIEDQDGQVRTEIQPISGQNIC